jgi:hypothetical protein
MKGGFALIALGLLQVLDRAIDLKPRRRADNLVAVRIDGDQSHLADRAIARARQKHGYDPEVVLAHQPLRLAAEAAERIVTNNVAVGRLQYFLGRRIIAPSPTRCRYGLLRVLHVRRPLGPEQPMQADGIFRMGLNRQFYTRQVSFA